MKIKQITNQHRRDFSADMKCEFCEGEQKLSNGYDDKFFHENVIPKINCVRCGKSTISGGGTVEKTETKYPEGFQI